MEKLTYFCFFSLILGPVCKKNKYLCGTKGTRGSGDILRVLLISKKDESLGFFLQLDKDYVLYWNVNLFPLNLIIFYVLIKKKSKKGQFGPTSSTSPTSPEKLKKLEKLTYFWFFSIILGPVCKKTKYLCGTKGTRGSGDILRVLLFSKKMKVLVSSYN